MDYKMNIKEKKIYNLIKDFADSQMNLYSSETFSRDLWNKCCEYGILALLTPKEVGGMGEDVSSIFSVAKYLGKTVKDSGFVFAINNSLIVSTFLLPKYANEELIEECYPGLYNGELIGCYAITEPDSGSDVYRINTTYELQEDFVVLNGAKIYISNATIANVFAIVAKDMLKDEYSIFLVRKEDVGFEIGKEILKMGLESCPMGEVILNKCKIPRNRVIGKIGEGMQISNMALDFERSCSFASHLGTMERIMDDCIKYVNIRNEFGKSIGSYQLVAEKIAKMKIDIELGNLLLKKITDMKDQGKNTYMESAIFKYFVGEEYSKTCIEALQIYGAYGYSKEGEIEHEVRNALAAKIYSGTSEIQLEIISRMLGVRK